MLLVPLCFHRALRRDLGRALVRRKRAAAALAGAGLLALALKLFGATAAEPPGLAACYGTPIAPAYRGQCEMSFENPFFRGGVTRFDSRLDFGPGDWNLGFFNSMRFNLFKRPWEHPRRDRLPLHVRWTGAFEAPGADRVEVEYTGEATLALGGIETPLPPSYASTRQVVVRPAAGPWTVRIDYRFDDGTRGRQPPPGPYATFRLRARDAAGREVGVRSGPFGAAATAGAVAARAADALTAALAVALLLHFLRRLAPDLKLWLPVAAAAALLPAYHDADIPFDVAPGLFVCSALLIVVTRRRRARDVVTTWLGCVALALVILAPTSGGLARVALRTPGDDWIAYESFARSILEERSLRGGEWVFFFQPLFRYWRFAERLLLGEGDLLVAACAFAALNASLLLGLRRLGGRAPATAVAAGLLLLGFNHAAYGGLRFVVLGASEYPTWILAPLALSRLFASRGARAALQGAAMIGLAALTRLNQLPGLLALFAASALRARREPRRWIAGAALIAGLLLLPLAHNALWGRRAEPLTMTRAQPQSLVLPPERALATPRGRAQLVRQVRHALMIFRPSWEWGLLWPALHGLQLLYVVSVVRWLRSGRPDAEALLVAASPLLILGVHLFYIVNNYYPRHILAAHQLMGLVSVLLASGAGRRDGR
jgi:hypothetical protein